MGCSGLLKRAKICRKRRVNSSVPKLVFISASNAKKEVACLDKSVTCGMKANLTDALSYAKQIYILNGHNLLKSTRVQLAAFLTLVRWQLRLCAPLTWFGFTYLKCTNVLKCDLAYSRQTPKEFPWHETRISEIKVKALFPHRSPPEECKPLTQGAARTCTGDSLPWLQFDTAGSCLWVSPGSAAAGGQVAETDPR